MKHKLGVCVPYRNRELHLHEFIPKVGKYLKEQGIDFCMDFVSGNHFLELEMKNCGMLYFSELICFLKKYEN